MRRRRMQVAWSLLLWATIAGASCASPGWGRARRYADAPFVEPVEAPADQADADDGPLHGGPRKRQPVFGEEPKRSPEPPPTPLTRRPGPPSAMEQIIAGATLQREYPGFQEHHLFPRQRELRVRFRRMGIDVDAWTILVDSQRHAAAHGDQGRFGLGGRWNQEWRDWLRGTADPSVEEAFAQALRMIGEHRLSPYGLLTPYGCGRTIAHDLYDIVEPPAQP